MNSCLRVSQATFYLTLFIKHQTLKINNYFSANTAYTSKFSPEATTPFKPQKELVSVAFLVLWLCASVHKAFRLRRGEGFQVSIISIKT